MTYLIDVGMKNDGRLTNNAANKQWSYEHSIALYALAEAYTFCNQLGINVPNLKEVVQRAGQFMIDHQNDNGATCLMYAASTGKHAVVEALLAAGANPQLETLDGFSALDMAATIECLRLLRRVEQEEAHMAG
jgi:hypothetical protein